MSGGCCGTARTRAIGSAAVRQKSAQDFVIVFLFGTSTAIAAKKCGYSVTKYKYKWVAYTVPIHARVPIVVQAQPSVLLPGHSDSSGTDCDQRSLRYPSHLHPTPDPDQLRQLSTSPCRYSAIWAPPHPHASPDSFLASWAGNYESSVSAPPSDHSFRPLIWTENTQK